MTLGVVRRNSVSSVQLMSVDISRTEGLYRPWLILSFMGHSSISFLMHKDPHAEPARLSLLPEKHSANLRHVFLFPSNSDFWHH